MAGVNKVIGKNGEVIIDISGDTVTAALLAEGATAHAANGDVVTGIGQDVSFIDDTAGAGDVGYVWSADKSYTEITDLKSALEYNNADIGIRNVFNGFDSDTHNGVTIKRYNNVFVVDGDNTESGGHSRFVLNGKIEHATTTKDEWVTRGLNLIEGRKYKMILTILSGSIPSRVKEISFNIMNSNKTATLKHHLYSPLENVSRYNIYISDEFIYNPEDYACLMFYAGTSSAFDNYTFNVSFIDVTNYESLLSDSQALKATWGHIDGTLADQTDLKNALDSMINDSAGSGDTVTAWSADKSYKEITALDSAIQFDNTNLGERNFFGGIDSDTHNGVTIKRYNNVFVVDGDNTESGGHSRFVLNGKIEHATTTKDEWVTRGLNLIEGRKYKMILTILSGSIPSRVKEISFNIMNSNKTATLKHHLYSPLENVSRYNIYISDEFIYNPEDYACLMFYAGTSSAFDNYTFNVSFIDVTNYESLLSNSQKIKELEYEISNFDYTYPPDYYFSQNYLTDKVDNINQIAINLSYKSLQFIFFTDYHKPHNACVSPKLMSYITKYTGINQVVFGGDAINSDYSSRLGGVNLLTDFLRDFIPLEKTANIYYITGNHELNDPNREHEQTSRLNQQVVYRLFNSRNQGKIKNLYGKHHAVSMNGVEQVYTVEESNTFYVDFDAEKIRAIFVDCNYDAYTTIDSRIGAICAMETVPEDYAVILFAHKAIAGSGTAEFDNILACAAAMNDGTSATIALVENVESHNYSVNVDFTNKQRTFIGALSGHFHVDRYSIYDDRFPVICSHSDTGAYKEGSVMVAGTVTEQSFDVVQIDLVAKRIYMTRIGFGNDRVFSFGVQGAGSISE